MHWVVQRGQAVQGRSRTERRISIVALLTSLQGRGAMNAIISFPCRLLGHMTRSRRKRGLARYRDRKLAGEHEVRSVHMRSATEVKVGGHCFNTGNDAFSREAEKIGWFDPTHAPSYRVVAQRYTIQLPRPRLQLVIFLALPAASQGMAMLGFELVDVI